MTITWTNYLGKFLEFVYYGLTVNSQPKKVSKARANWTVHFIDTKVTSKDPDKALFSAKKYFLISPQKHIL